MIVVDFFHWPLQGDWKFDPTYWPDPDAMIAQLKEMGIELMVSIWPTVDKRNPRYREMLEKGLLIRTDRGVRVAMEFQGSTVHYDATNPAARDYVWDIAKENYYDKGVRIFWLDEAEPEYTAYDFDNYRYYLGPNTKVGNSYPCFTPRPSSTACRPRARRTSSTCCGAPGRAPKSTALWCGAATSTPALRASATSSPPG